MSQETGSGRIGLAAEKYAISLVPQNCRLIILHALKYNEFDWNDKFETSIDLVTYLQKNRSDTDN